MLSAFFPYEYVADVFSIDYLKLYQDGFRGLIFDIDNTLVHHGDDATPEIEKLFRHLHGIGFKTLLLTNNGESRVQRFLKNIDSMYICNADKPDPAGYLKAVEMLQIKKEEALFIGDQIFIDIYGANKSGIANILVHYILLDGETKIGIRRYLEKGILMVYRLCGKYRHRLGSIQTKEYTKDGT